MAHLRRDEPGERGEVEREERRLACEEALFLRDQAFERDISDRERRVLAQAMATCLEDVPPGEIVGLMQQELQNPSSKYLPKAPDLLRRWKGIDWAEEDGRAERVTVANASAYQPLHPTANEVAMRSALPSPADASSPARRDWEQLGEKLRRGVRHAQAEPFKAERITPRDDTLLGRALDDWGGMAVWKVRRELWSAFGWWLLNRTPVAQWTPDLVKAAWIEWQQERLAEQGDAREEVPDGATHA